MNIEQVREYTLSLLGVTEDQAFGEDILNFRLEGKIFVCLWLGGSRYDMKDGVSRIALKLSPDRDIDLAEDRWDFSMAAGYGLTEFLSEDGVRLVTRDDIDMAVMEDGSCLVFITV